MRIYTKQKNRMNMRRKPLIAIISILIVFSCFFVGCGNSPSTNSFDVTVGDYTFAIPDRYNSELSQSDDESVLIADKETGMNGFITICLVNQTGSFTQYYKDAMLENGIKSMHLDNVETLEGNPLSFTGYLSGLKMEGAIDMLYSTEADKAAMVFILRQSEADYDYCQDLGGIVSSASVNGKTGAYSEPVTGSYNGGGLDIDDNNDNDYAPGSDWEKYDKNKDGKISDEEFQDATGDYIDKYFDENGTDGNLNAYDYNGNGEMEDREFQDAVEDYMNENGY